MPTHTIPGPTRAVIDMPAWSAIIRRAGSTLLVVTIVPMALFYVVLSMFGLAAAVLSTLVWYYGGMLVNIIRGRPVLAAALVGAGFLSIRAGVMFLTGNEVVYFLQPVGATMITATVFAVSAVIRRPVLDRLAHEFCPFPDELSVRLRANRFFCWLSAIWATAYVIDAGGTVWLLTRSSVSDFVLLKTVMSPLLTIGALAASYLLFRRVVRRDDVVIRWGADRESPVLVGPPVG